MRRLAVLGLFVPLLLTACHPRAPAVSQSSQHQQLASLIAGTRYLKNQCGRSDLPSDGQIEQAAYQAAWQRGWTPTATEAAQAEQLYQRLLNDATPRATQCAEFTQLLAPFVSQLAKA